MAEEHERDADHPDDGDAEAATQEEIRLEALEEPDDPTTRREEVELDRMEAREPDKR